MKKLLNLLKTTWLKLTTKQKWIVGIIGFFVLVAFIPTSQTEVQNSETQVPTTSTNNNNNEKEKSENKKDLKISKIIIRFGNHDVSESIKRGFSYEEYKDTSLTTITKTIENPEDGKEIEVAFQEGVEVEVLYESLDLKGQGLFGGGSEFRAEPQEGSGATSNIHHAGGGKAWKIDHNRAIVRFHPTSFVPYGDGGKTKLILNLETKTGEKFRKEWTFIVGKNPAVYPNP